VKKFCDKVTPMSIVVNNMEPCDSFKNQRLHVGPVPIDPDVNKDTVNELFLCDLAYRMRWYYTFVFCGHNKFEH
jgi:hypothetical protein